MSVDPARVVERACLLATRDRDQAAALIASEYPFVPSRPVRRGFTKHQAMSIFVRDGFIDRYSGDLLVNPGALCALSELLPEVFPYHSHGKRDESHIAFWELWPTVDHVVPLAQGGAHDDSNFATTSMLRNLAKRNSTLDHLGWSLHDAGTVSDWDGLSGWFIDFVESERGYLEPRHINDWYRATKAKFAS